MRHQKGRCTALIPANVPATAVRSQLLRLDCPGFASGRPGCQALDGKANPGNQHLTLWLPLARGHQIRRLLARGWRWDKTWHKLVSRVYLSSYWRCNVPAGKTLLECLVPFKVKLERFLSRETRWVELDSIEVDKDHTALNITSTLQRKYAQILLNIYSKVHVTNELIFWLNFRITKADDW